MVESHQIFEQLISKAKKLAVKRELTSDTVIGQVACIAVSRSGKKYTGLNLKAAGGLGFCAEVAALLQMINAGETEVELLVAVNSDGEVIPPCGRCRELLFQINRQNLKTKIIFHADKSIELKELLPHPWQEYWGGRV